MDTKQVTVQLVKDLLASEKGLMPYTLYKRYGVTPIALVQIVKKLQDKGYLQFVEENRMILTTKGKDNAEGLISSLSRTSKRIRSPFFDAISVSILDKRIPYLPSMHFFNELNKEGDENG